jgi:hypothetical protein
MVEPQADAEIKKILQGLLVRKINTGTNGRDVRAP